ncbi:MAG: hypothetical protein MRJ93_12025 [Nitrososphaeraceae archaeon]|nr:hypothetical protein [Nitrososphaeraceae archaeon]
MNKKNIKEVIEPEFKHEVRADVSIAELRNNKVMASVQVEPDFDNNPIYAVAATTEQQYERPKESVGPTEETDQKKLNQAKAAYNKCLQIMNKIKFPEEQGQQICQLLRVNDTSNGRRNRRARTTEYRTTKQ